jgi:hypothetical protein
MLVENSIPECGLVVNANMGVFIEIVNKNIEVYINLYYFCILCPVLLINPEHLGLVVS